jgi:sugar phosphate isomerase/epimerase
MIQIMRIMKNNMPWTLVVNAPYELVRDRIGLIRKLEIGVEIYFGNDVIDEVSDGDVKETGRILRGEGIECSVHAPFMDLSPGAVDRAVRGITKEKLKKTAAMANLLGAIGMVCHPGYDRWRFGEAVDLWLEGAVETFDEVLGVAGEGFPVMLENIFEEEPDTIHELLRHFDGKNLYFCFDSGHFNLFTNVTLDKWISMLGNNIREMHLHDNYGKRDDHMPIGEGMFPFRELKAFLKGHRESLILTAEIHNEADAVQGIKNLKEFAG